MAPISKVLVSLAIETEVDQRFAMHFARASYLRKLAMIGVVPVLVSPGFSTQALDLLYSECQGALFMGGDDIDPATYGQAKHEKSGPFSLARDQFEIMLAKRLMADRKPILGICRGLQLLTIAGGGELIQDIPSQNIANMQHVLRDPSASYAAYLTQLDHPIQIKPDSKLAKILGQQSVLVNSAHHQAVAKVAKDFIVSATSEDGIIEAIEHRDPDYFCIAVQSHPEALDASWSDKLFKAFFECL